MRTASIIAVATVFAGALWLLWKMVSGQTGTIDMPNTAPPAPQTLDTDIFSRKVQELARAIAHAEGFGVAGAIPTVFHNPGDLGPGDTGYPGEYHSGSTVSKLPNDSTGWNFLYRKLANIFTGASSSYSVDMTFTEMAQKYAGDWSNWANNVTSYLQQEYGYPVSPQTTIRAWLEA